MFSNISAILAKEFKSDFRNPYALVGAGLFLLSSIFVCYISLKRINTASTWVAIYWIVVLFASFNAVAKSFVNESRGRMLYYYSLVNPASFIAAKMVYHSLIMIVLSITGAVVFSTMFSIDVSNITLFWISILLGAIGMAFTLSLLSTIAGKAGSNFTLLAILGLPLLLPLILVSTTLMKNAIDGLAWTVQWKYLFVLSGLDMISFILSVILFPYLWRE
ncbi:MAG: heme exporter protein CcmB [Flavobacteriales bacterium]